MKDKILKIVREAIDLHVLPATHKDVGVEIVGVGRCMRKISAELDKVLPIETPPIFRTKGTVALSEEDIAKIESCGFKYDRERQLMLKIW